MKTPDIIIHIEWEGPIALKDIGTYTSEEDYGVYQIYGGHPVYGSDVLLYIGRAVRQHFGVRIAQERHWSDNRDADRLAIYLGKFAAEQTPSDDVWGKQIDLAERLLIFAHSPAYNAQKSIRRIDTDLQPVHVFNWGYHRDLLPEVSGARWTSKFGEMPKYHVFNSEDPRV
jgi:hypothetical protein